MLHYIIRQEIYTDYSIKFELDVNYLFELQDIQLLYGLQRQDVILKLK